MSNVDLLSSGTVGEGGVSSVHLLKWGASRGGGGGGGISNVDLLLNDNNQLRDTSKKMNGGGIDKSMLRIIFLFSYL